MTGTEKRKTCPTQWHRQKFEKGGAVAGAKRPKNFQPEATPTIRIT